jgi:hypothetical protein
MLRSTYERYEKCIGSLESERPEKVRTLGDLLVCRRFFEKQSVKWSGFNWLKVMTSRKLL